ncbi:MAG TPA: flagellin [Chloroflexota bacterium]|nr:flagellin [Chloroflexota bacterium]
MTLSFAADYQSAALGVGGTDLQSAANAQNAQTQVDAAITTVSTGQATFGAKQSELDSLKNALDEANVANNDLLSKIQDADVAAETSRLVRDQLLAQVGASALSAATFAPGVLTRLLTPPTGG